MSMAFSLVRPMVIPMVRPLLPSEGDALLLDTLAVQPVAAYSLRKLRTAYTGACIRVRRSSDNAELDIGFSGNVLDTAAMLAHVGVNNGFVVTWYDQSGGNNATNAAALDQPQIVSAGAVLLSSGKPTVLFDGVSDRLLSGAIPALNGSTPLTLNGVVNPESFPGIFKFWFCAGSSGAAAASFELGTGNPSNAFYAGVSGVAGGGTALTAATPYVLTGVFTAATQPSWSNGAANSSVLAGAMAGDGAISFCAVGAGNYGNARISEHLAFGSQLSDANRQFLERAQGAFYGIAVA
jgi:hypothetical protein